MAYVGFDYKDFGNKDVIDKAVFFDYGRFKIVHLIFFFFFT